MHLNFKTLLLIFSVSLVVFIGSCSKGGGSEGSTTQSPASTTSPTDSNTPSTNPSTSVATWIGTKLLGVATKFTSAQGVGLDNSGNVYVAGYTNGNLDGQTLTGTQDLFVVKYNISGTKQWTQLLGVTAQTTQTKGASVDSSGNTYVVGFTDGNLDGQTLTGSSDLFVVKYNSLGAKQWTRLLGATAFTFTNAFGVSVDSSGNSYVVGSTTGNLDGQTKTGSQDLFIVKYNTLGVKQWTRLLGVTAGTTYCYGVSLDSSANAYVVGYTNGNLDGQTKTGSNDLLIVKYDTLGVKQWTRLLGVAASSNVAYGVSVDSSANAYVVGYTNGNLDGQTKTGSQDLFIVKYDTLGVKQWTRLLGVTAGTTNSYRVSVDSSANAYVVGKTDGNLDGQTKTGFEDAFIVKYDTLGVKQWTQLLGVTAGTTNSYGVSVDSSANAYVVGYTTGNLDGQTKTGSGDLFLTKYNSSGTKQ